MYQYNTHTGPACDLGCSHHFLYGNVTPFVYTHSLLVWVDSCSHLPGKEWRSRKGHLFHLSIGHFFDVLLDTLIFELHLCLVEMLYMYTLQMCEKNN